MEHVGPRWRLRALVPVPSRSEPCRASRSSSPRRSRRRRSGPPWWCDSFLPPRRLHERRDSSARPFRTPRLVRNVRAECSLPIRTETPTHAFPRPFPPILPSLRSPSRSSLFSAPSASPRAFVPRVRPDSPRRNSPCGDGSSPSQPPSSRASASCRRATPPSDPIGPDDASTATRSDGPDSRNSPARDSTSRNSCHSSSSSPPPPRNYFSIASPPSETPTTREPTDSPRTPRRLGRIRRLRVWVYTLHHLRRRPRGPFPRLRV